MHLFSAVRPQVVSEFKVALIYLEQWELLNPGGHYNIPLSGRIRSPELDIKTRGSLGYLFDWFLRPNKNKKQLSIATTDIQLGIKRRTSLVSLYRLEYSGEDLVDSISTDQFLTRNPSERRTETVGLYTSEGIWKEGGGKESCAHLRCTILSGVQVTQKLQQYCCLLPHI